MIRWRRSNDSYATSHCGRWKISPLFWGCIHPQWFELRRDDVKIDSMFETQRAAKVMADELDAAVAQDLVTPAENVARRRRYGA